MSEVIIKGIESAEIGIEYWSKEIEEEKGDVENAKEQLKKWQKEKELQTNLLKKNLEQNVTSKVDVESYLEDIKEWIKRLEDFLKIFPKSKSIQAILKGLYKAIETIENILKQIF